MFVSVSERRERRKGTAVGLVNESTELGAVPFANPAITIGRMFTDTFAGIAPSSAGGYLLAQVVGAALGLGCVLLFFPQDRPKEH